MWPWTAWIVTKCIDPSAATPLALHLSSALRFSLLLLWCAVGVIPLKFGIKPGLALNSCNFIDLMNGDLV